jgi:hypothetical protein
MYPIQAAHTRCVLLGICRTIPLPGIDDWGFRVGKATFFSVPRDRGRYASYEARGRQDEEWFMSE